MQTVLRHVVTHVAAAGAITVRATFMIFNGLIIAAFVSFFPILGATAPLGALLHGIFDHYQVTIVSGFGVAFFSLLLLIDLALIGALFLGRHLIPAMHKQDDLGYVSNAFDFLFMIYGIFLGVTSLLIWSYYRWDASIFAEGNVSFWRIFLYVIDVGLRGFLQDLMEYADIRPALKPVGIMYHVNFLLKVIMALTVVSGALKYRELTKGRAGMLPR